jgi:two-component sensor histidine kinase
LLDITRYNTGHYKFNLENVDIVHISHAIVKSVDVYAKQKGIELIFSTDIKSKKMAIDEEKYERILLNLLSNAIKFTPTGKSIHVYTRCKDKNVIISIKDNGVGIPKSKQLIIFERFGQVDNSLTRQSEGTGIGLSLVKTLVEAMNGTIEVDSEKNKGSTFSFSVRLGLPRVTEMVYYDSHDKFPNLNLCKVIADSKEKYIKEKNEISDIDYINRMLQDISSQEKEVSVISMQKSIIYMNEILEKLVICIEMENWEKSEELAYSIKNLIPKNHTVNSKIILRLLLAVRKENHDDSLKIINEIKSRMLLEK